MASEELEKQPESALDLPKLEEEVLAFWERERIFERSIEERPLDKQFVFFEGPPTANAKPAIHHVLGRTFKDAIPRYKTMQGFRVERKAGWDTHGLPVELQVEKALGISGKPQIEQIVKGDVAASIAKFNQLCEESVWQHKTEWERLTKRMGFWLDMSDPYITLDRSYIESVWWVLKQVWDKQLLYEDFKVVPYCFRCGTALSSHEVALGYEEVVDQSIYVKFAVEGRPGTYLLAWTTTPWTLPGNVALAINPSIAYSVYELGTGEKLIMADERAATVLGDVAHESTQITADELLTLSYVPLFKVQSLQSERSYKVYPADFVTTADGTGIVHTAVMYGEEDFQLGSSIGLPKHHTVDVNGLFTDDVTNFSGRKAKDTETEQAIVAQLEASEQLFKSEEYTHTYPFCWRCTTPLIYYAKRSWFIRMSALRDKLVENNVSVNWVPEHLRDGRFGEWLREVKDWALSRDRYWGTPLPIWHCDACDQKLCMGSFEELTKHSGKSAPDDIHRPSIDEVTFACTECNTGTMRRYPEVIDVWFDSGAMPFAQQHYPFDHRAAIDEGKAYPADYISEGIDQTRGWFYTLMAIATLLELKAPYKNVVSYGHLLDQQGKKMSKSKGNVVDPWTAIAEFGIDPIRWYFYSVNQPADTKKFHPLEISQGTRKVFLIVWNMLNFVTLKSAGEQAEAEVLPANQILDDWLDQRLMQTTSQVTSALDQYDFFHATRAIRAFCTELSTWYLRLSRKRGDAQFLVRLKIALKSISLLLAPFTPFFAEMMWQKLKTKDDVLSVHLASWPMSGSYDALMLETMQAVQGLVEQGRAVRAKLGIPTRQPLAAIVIRSGVMVEDRFMFIIKNELNVKSVSFSFVQDLSEISVEYDTEITDELRSEGLAREITRAIQGLRKQAGLQVTDQALVTIDGPDTTLRQLDSHLATILSTTHCTVGSVDEEGSVTSVVSGLTIKLLMQ